MEKVTRTRTENEHYSLAGIEPSTGISIIIMAFILMAFSWHVIQEVKTMNAMEECTAEAKSPAGLLQVHIKRFGDCDAIAVAVEAQRAVLVGREVQIVAGPEEKQ